MKTAAKVWQKKEGSVFDEKVVEEIYAEVGRCKLNPGFSKFVC